MIDDVKNTLKLVEQRAQLREKKSYKNQPFIYVRTYSIL
jgi:hypothetical protein